MRLSWRDSLWLVVAIAVHAALLLTPLRTPAPVAKPETIVSVSLLAPPPIHKEPAIKEPEPVHDPEPAPPPREKPLQEMEPVLAEQPVTSEPEYEDEIPEQTLPDVPESFTTARLITSASELKWTLPEESQTRQLGVFKPRPEPANWQPAIELEENRFSEMYAPAETEILDRWLAADGSHNVVVNTPTGDTLCGRAKAWNPMSPLVEHIMMWRPCGGGGKRAFKMPERFMRTR